MREGCKAVKVIISLVIIFALTVGMVAAVFAQPHEYYSKEDILNNIKAIIEWKLGGCGVESVGDLFAAPLINRIGDSWSDWYAIAFARYDESIDFSEYAAALDEYINKNNVTKLTDRQRFALIYAVMGHNKEYVIETAAASFEAQTINASAYALILIQLRDLYNHTKSNDSESNKAQVSDISNTANIIEQILAQQLPDGGWALTGKVSDVDITAIVIQALAPYLQIDILKRITFNESLTEERIKSAAAQGIELLSARQKDSGGYSGWGGENPESSAQVINALCALGIDPQQDDRFIKAGNSLLDAVFKFKTSEGGFVHTIGGGVNDSATVQVLCALISLLRKADDMSSFYLFDMDFNRDSGNTDMEIIDGTDTASDKNTDKISDQTSDTVSDVVYENANRITGKAVKLALLVIIAIVLLTALLAAVLCGKTRRIPALLITAVIVALAVGMSDIKTPEEYYGTDSERLMAGDPKVSISINCEAALGSDEGTILAKTQYRLNEGDSVFSLLERAAKQNRIQIDYTGTAGNALSGVYLRGINGVYEADYGVLSGWLYLVNGNVPGISCDSYILEEGDYIELVYSLELGLDIGAELGADTEAGIK